MTTVIVDGYNVIHAVPALARCLDRSLEAAREALVAVCQAYRARRGDVRRLCVVFDGAAAHEGWPQAERGGVVIRFTRGAEEADGEILRMLRESGREPCAVVSNDNVVCNNARAHRAQVVSAEAFYAVALRRPLGASENRRRAQPPVEKMTLPCRDAQAITEEYRRHLERVARERAARPRTGQPR